MDLSFTCEICGQQISRGEPTIRVVAETCISDGIGGGAKVEDDVEIVFTIFHKECVMATYASRECDVIAYICEAREVVDGHR